MRIGVCLPNVSFGGEPSAAAIVEVALEAERLGSSAWPRRASTADRRGPRREDAVQGWWALLSFFITVNWFQFAR